MSKYIGTPVVSLSTDTVDVTGDITTTDATPEVIIVNDTHEDTDGGREGKVTFKGQASGGEETTLAQIQASHDGTSDDEKGDLIFKTNDGSDGASPTERMRIDSLGNVGIGVTPKTGGSTWQHIQFGGTGNIIGRQSDSTVDAFFASNYYINSSGQDSYIATGDAARMFFNDDIITFSNAGSGSADAALTFVERMRIASNGDISFYEDTGTTPKFFWDASAESLGIGSSPTSLLHLESDTPVITLRDTSAYSAGTGPYIQFQGLDSGSTNRVFGQIYGLSNGSNSGELAFYTRNSGSTAEAMRISSAGNVGIGTSSPSAKLHSDVGASSTTGVLAENANDAASTGDLIKAYSARGNTSAYNLIKAENSTGVKFLVSGSGNVGIGTSSPDRKFHIKTADNIIGLIESTDADAWLTFKDNTSSTDNAVRVGATGDNLRFYAGAAERMRIDSSGNVLVGKTATSSDTAGITLNSNGAGWFTGDGIRPLLINRKTSDGSIAEFRKDGTTVGSIGSSSSALVIDGGSGYTGLQFATSVIAPRDNGALNNGGVGLGNVNYRFGDIYSSNGTIQTSDENEKQAIASLTNAEITAATAISKLFKTYKWKDAVAKKGDDARTHTGVIAQQVEQAMTDAGLDASKYAFWCSNTWWEKDVEVAAVEAVEAQDAVYDDDGNLVTEAVEGIEAKDAYTRTDIYDTLEEAPEGATEHTRMGVRYHELLAFIGAATEQRLTSIESRLTALEGE